MKLLCSCGTKPIRDNDPAKSGFDLNRVVRCPSCNRVAVGNWPGIPGNPLRPSMVIVCDYLSECQRAQKQGVLEWWTKEQVGL